MGKTIRRKDLKNNGYFTISPTRGEHSDEVANAIFHGDTVRNWKGMSPSVKSRQNEISRTEKRRIQKNILEGREIDCDMTGKSIKAKANECHQFD